MYLCNYNRFQSFAVEVCIVVSTHSCYNGTNIFGQKRKFLQLIKNKNNITV